MTIISDTSKQTSQSRPPDGRLLFFPASEVRDAFSAILCRTSVFDPLPVLSPAIYSLAAPLCRKSWNTSRDTDSKQQAQKPMHLRRFKSLSFRNQDPVITIMSKSEGSQTCIFQPSPSPSSLWCDRKAESEFQAPRIGIFHRYIAVHCHNNTTDKRQSET